MQDPATSALANEIPGNIKPPLLSPRSTLLHPRIASQEISHGSQQCDRWPDSHVSKDGLIMMPH